MLMAFAHDDTDLRSKRDARDDKGERERQHASSHLQPVYLGLSSTIMSLGRIAIAIGELADAVIVLIENAHVRLSGQAGKVFTLSATCHSIATEPEIVHGDR